MSRRTSKRRDRPAGDAPVLIYGFHAAAAALANPARRIGRIMATRNAAARIAEECGALDREPEIVLPRALDALLPRDAVHQGVLIEAEPLAVATLADIEPAAKRPLIVLDKVTDPRNVGAVLRAAAAFGASHLIMTRRNRPPESGVLAKAASGGLEHVGLVEVPNLSRALGELADRGVYIAGLDSDGDEAFEGLEVDGPLALALGAEGEGLRALTRRHCDGIYRLTVPGPIRSLNVSTAAAVALHALATSTGRDP